MEQIFLRLIHTETKRLGSYITTGCTLSVKNQNVHFQCDALFPLPDSDSDSDSDSYGYIVLCRTCFHCMDLDSDSDSDPFPKWLLYLL